MSPWTPSHSNFRKSKIKNNPEVSQRWEGWGTTHLYRSKDKRYIWHLRKHARKKVVEWNIQNIKKKKSHQLNEIIFRKWRRNTSSDKQKLRELIANRPALQEKLKELLQRERKWYRSETQVCIKKGRALGNKYIKVK